jgi:lysophospholipase L1-like esterase
MKLSDIANLGRFKLIGLIVALSMCFPWFVWGAFTVSRQIFPFRVLELTKNFVFGDRPHKANWYERVAYFKEMGQISGVVEVGDSLVENGQWSEVMNCVVLNRGISGDTSDGILERLGEESFSPNTVVLLHFGINDFFRGHSVGMVLANYLKIVSFLKSQGAQVVVQSTIECREGVGPGCRDVRGDIMRLNSQLKDAASASGFEFIDLNSIFADRQGLKRELTTDGIHIRQGVYKDWASMLLARSMLCRCVPANRRGAAMTTGAMAPPHCLPPSTPLPAG